MAITVYSGMGIFTKCTTKHGKSKAPVKLPLILSIVVMLKVTMVSIGENQIWVYMNFKVRKTITSYSLEDLWMGLMPMEGILQCLKMKIPM